MGSHAPVRVVVYETITYHVIGPLLAGLVAPGFYTVVGMAVAKTTAFDNKVVDRVVVRGEDGISGTFGLAGTRLALQQTDPQVGDHELVLGSRSIGVHLVPRRQGSIDHLEIEEEGSAQKLSFPLVKSCCTSEKRPTAHNENINHVSLSFLYRCLPNKTQASGLPFMLLKVLLFLENQSSSSVNMDKCFLCSFIRFFRYIHLILT